ncbi:MAG TPA: hypothetical protein DCQ99_02030 [Nitrospinae bacterium]|nr:hypothetical protein [Nitrospinota bacterium]HBA26809.1 hypothetical protein [Nitrospinota bacterium]
MDKLFATLVITFLLYSPSFAFEYEKKVFVEREKVAFVEIKSDKPVDIFIMYSPQYKNYTKSGSTEGAFDMRNIRWYIYPIPAMFDDQTVYFIVKEGAEFKVTYENVKERIDRLFKGDMLLRSGADSFFKKGIDSIRLTQNLPDLQIEIEASEDVQIAVVKVMDYISLTRGKKSFEEIYENASFKGVKSLNFRSPDFDDLYLIAKSENGVNIKYKTWANKDTASSGC